ncbi:MAG TPA: EAL domain-containing protein, partial [Ideonella sp.]|nr:EAL domain-containing protein [Ideonella sp.]
RQLQATLASGRGGRVELQSDTGGGLRSFSVEFIAECDEHGSICGALAIGRDVTQQVRGAHALAEKEREFRSLAENAGDIIMRWDTECRLLYVNPAGAGFLDKPLEQLIGRLPVDASGGGPFRAMYEAVLRVVRDGRPAMLDLRLPAPGGAGTLVHQVRLVPERDAAGRVCSVLGIGRDVSEKVAQLELIESLVRTDPLTRLANRQALHERAPALFAAARRNGRQVAVMLLDLDQFKSINDGLGHSAGDTLLCETARRLGACLRGNDLLVRQGGDEFVVVAPDIGDAEVLGAITDKLHRALSAPLQLHGRELHISASIGVALFPADGEGLEPLLAHADSAMYHAKRGGRGRTEFFRRELGDAVQRRLLLEAALREASDGAGLELHFQPQVCLQHQDRLVGAEALLRWRHPSLGMLAPDAFIGLAEESGMIVPIGRWVLHSAARAAARWNRGRCTPLRIAVNVSTRQFVQGDLGGELRDILAETGCDPRWLSVEITESALLENSSRVQQVLDGMRALGVHVALDDFGTGYSALHYLARFPVDGLKIDKSFVQGIGRSERENEVVKAFIAMASALKMDLVAEGIESAPQAAFLLAEGCLHGQGWRFGRPMPADRFEQLLQARAAA